MIMYSENKGSKKVQILSNFLEKTQKKRLLVNKRF
jgi:hypothetical protein